MSHPIQVTTKDNIATIVLNRPKVFNSFNREMALDFQRILENCETDEKISAIIITGSGKAFCAGQDLQEVIHPDTHPGFQTIIDHYNTIILKIRNIQKPILAAVNGVAAGAGANIALACDIVIASEAASFIQAFSSIGLIPDSGGTFLLPRLIGFQKASALAMLGDKISAKEAERLGMIYAFSPPETFQQDVYILARKLAKMPTKALGLTKVAFNRSLKNTLEEQLALELDLQLKASKTIDYAEGVRAFIEKRKPVFKGK